MTDLAHPLWIEPWPLVLASASSSRAGMLRAAGIPLEIAPADIDERAIEDELGDDAGLIAAELAAAKAVAVSARFPNRLVLGADQTLTVGSERLHKPSGLADARAQLLKLRDREHVLTSAAALVVDGAVLETFISAAKLYMRPFTEEFLDRYLGQAGDAVMTSVGGYQLEGAGVHLFNRVEADHFTVLGLPLLQVLASLRARGMLLE
ncbi:Maf-like protein [Terrihabitans soli]|uniref:Nucleoside triphosphate pyrophosphatase n=1 Tax=Terrihabitans soli TaxID=708113 RepID=A0A6S6QS83_9HYPH|nr:Maf family protein [Terrihabitans soli]BCJ89318.1 Maf-like protein [Terrihabitans soli]